MEKDVLFFIKSLYSGEIIENNRKLVIYDNKPREIDIYLPVINVAFEFNGLYWHNELNKDPISHNEKTIQLLKKGICLYHIWEDDWIYKRKLVESRIKNILGLTDNKLGARKCIVKDIDQETYKNFCDANHIQGYCRAKITIGLYYEGDLVSCCSFSRPRKVITRKGSIEYELIRLCSKQNYSIIGGTQKMFSFFIKKYDPETILTFSDASFSPDPNKSVYSMLGFKYTGTSDIGYSYIIDGIRRNRINYQKHLLVKQGFDPELTEVEIMNQRKYYRIFDCGQHKFTWTKNS